MRKGGVMKKVIVFFGGDSQVGTTMIAQSFAELLSQRGHRVLFILGSGKYGDSFIKMGLPHSIDDLKAGIRSGKIEKEELMQSLEMKKNLLILPGVRNPLMAKHFPENTYQILLESAKEEFDYIVIDGGSEFQLGITISALNYSDERFFLTTQQAKSLYRYALYRKQIFEPLNLKSRLIINKYLRDPALFLKSDILKFCGVSEAKVVPYIEYGWQAEMEGVSLMQHKGFYKAIEKLVEEYEPEIKKERRWKGNFA